MAFKPIIKGEIFTEDNIVAKRTGGEGISGLELDSVLGKHAAHNFSVNQIISLS